MNLKTLTTAMALAFASSAVTADVICSAPTGALSVRPACKKTEKIVSQSLFGGAQGPVGPAGGQGPIGPAGTQGPAGVGITNAACSQADTSGAWQVYLNAAYGTYTQADVCTFNFDASGNITSGSNCIQNDYKGAFVIPISTGTSKLNISNSCNFVLNFVKTNGETWSGLYTVDRTRSNILGGIGANGVGNTILAGTKLGAVNPGISSSAALNSQLTEQSYSTEGSTEDALKAGSEKMLPIIQNMPH